MPRQPQWYQRVPDALRTLEHFPAPVLDRQALEQLLGIGRRDAIRLMHRLGGYQCGRTFLIDSSTLHRALTAISGGNPWQWESRRRIRVAEQLDSAHREWTARRVVVPASTPGLPDTVTLRPDRLEIRFHGAVDLLTQLLQLTRTLSNDYERFQALLDE